MNIKEIQKSHPLVYMALCIIGDNVCGYLNGLYEFPDAACAELDVVESALQQLDGKCVGDIVSESDVAAQVDYWDERDDEEWKYSRELDAIDVVSGYMACYMTAIEFAIDGGKELGDFLAACFDGKYSCDANGNGLYLPDGVCCGI